MKDKVSLTREEIEVTTLAGEIFNKFKRLLQTHPSDLEDIVFHVHAIQNIVMSRVVQRTNPEDFPTYEVHSDSSFNKKQTEVEPLVPRPGDKPQIDPDKLITDLRRSNT